MSVYILGIFTWAVIQASYRPLITNHMILPMIYIPPNSTYDRHSSSAIKLAQILTGRLELDKPRTEHSEL